MCGDIIHLAVSFNYSQKSYRHNGAEGMSIQLVIVDTIILIQDKIGLHLIEQICQSFDIDIFVVVAIIYLTPFG